MTLTIKTDQADADIALYKNDVLVDSYSWLAGRQLSDTLLLKISQLLKDNNITAKDLKAVIVYQGPGSFTGLRIGISIANAMAYSLNIPVIASEGEHWVQHATSQMTSGKFMTVATPVYGAPANITKQRK